MTFLPIVARELRVASRRKTTFIVRSVIALLGMVIGGFLLVMLDVMGPMGGKGGMVFVVVSRYAVLIALLAGVMLASDCLSEERREGTLGFLFLTELKGYDVVLGKFAAVSLNAFYGMLAVFPVLAVSLLAGGVSGAEFWRTCLALVNTLFFSVAAALWVSALCKSAYRAMVRGGSPAGRGDRAGGHCVRVVGVGGQTRPGTVFRGRIESALVIPAGGGGQLFPSRGGILGIIGHLSWRGMDVPRIGELAIGLLQGKGRKQGSVAADHNAGRHGRAQGSPDRIARHKPRPLAFGRLAPLAMGRLVLAVLGGATLLLTAAMGSGFGAFFGTYLAWPFYFLIKVFFAIQACRFFSEGRRTGALELLCCTPMTMPAIISGQWMALRRIFLWPVTVLILCQLACLCFLGAAIFPGAVSKGAAATAPSLAIMGWYMPFLLLKQVANSIADFFAIGWFGMWLALSLQKPGAATGLTILYVLVLPALVFCIPTLATDTVFIIVGYSKLQQDFRGRGVSWMASHPA